MEFGTLVAAQNSLARIGAEPHPLRKVPKSNWPQSVSGGSISKAPLLFPGHDGGQWEPIAASLLKDIIHRRDLWTMQSHLEEIGNR